MCEKFLIGRFIPRPDKPAGGGVPRFELSQVSGAWLAMPLSVRRLMFRELLRLMDAEIPRPQLLELVDGLPPDAASHARNLLIALEDWT